MRIVKVKGYPDNNKIKFPDDMTDDQILEVMNKQQLPKWDQTLQEKATERLTPVDTMYGVEQPLSEKISQGVGNLLHDSGLISNRAGAMDIGKNIGFGAEMTPVIGDQVAADDFGRAVAEGDTFGMLANAAAAIPIIGGIAKRSINKAKNMIEAGADPKFLMDDPEIAEGLADLTAKKAQYDKLDEDIADPNIDVGEQSGFDRLVGDAPIVDPESLIGRTVVPTLADLTGAGKAYKGIDSSEVMPIELQGGAKFPMLESYNSNNIVWAVNDKGGQTKLQKGDIIAVSAMAPDSHRSNATVNEALINTMEQYIDDGRISKQNVKAISKLITADPKLKDFPPLANREKFDEYLSGLTFEKRKRLTQILASSKGQALGVPNFQKILDQTIDPDYAGSNLGDNLLLIEVDKTPDARVELGKDGTKKHKSYKYGVTGKVIGKFAKPVSNQTLFPDFFAQRRSDPTNETKGDYRSFSLSLPNQTITPEIAKQIGSEPFNAIKSPKQAKIADDFISDNWVDSTKKVKDGGVSVSGFTAALRNSEASPSLTLYSDKDLNREIKQGKTKIHKLGDSEIYFAIKNDYNYADEYGIDLKSAGLSPNEKAIVGVVNNEVGARGVAAPSVMLKAIEQGGTVLDAYAVKSAKYPDGFLPSLYGNFGFETVSSVPFDPSYTLNEGLEGLKGAAKAAQVRKNELKLQDLKALWKKDGWNESDGFPDITVMKYKGDDNGRATITKDWTDAIRRGDESSIIGRAKGGTISSAEKAFSQPSRSNGGKAGGVGDSRNDTGAIRNSGGSSQQRFVSLIDEVKGLDEAERKNLGMKPKPKYTIE